jgi:uncharacterized protein (TIGR02996 family)
VRHQPGGVMSSDEQALLRAIAAAPDDDTPRLVYADWLDEHGRPVRAEFIRLQCRIAQLDTKSQAVRNRNVGLFKRQQELLDAHLPELLGPLAGRVPDYEADFHRGFVAEVGLDVGAFLAHAADLAAALPRPAVHVEWVAARLTEFLRCEYLGCVTRVSAYYPYLFQDDTVLPDLPAEDDLLAAGRRLTRLEALDLEGCRLGDDGIRLLAFADLPALEELDLSGNHITDEGVAELVGFPVVRRLRRLILGGNPITDQGAFEIADRLGRHGRLEYLNLRFTPIGGEGQQALLARPWKVDLF